MTREEYRAALNNMIYLVSCAVKETVPDKNRIESMNLTNLYTIADFHLLTSAVAFALESAGSYDSAFTQAKAKAIRKIALMDAEMAEIFTKMEKAGIWYMPLKGTVLKDYYPKFGMREMSDHDILVDADRMEDVKAIMEGLGFRKDHDTSCHDSYFKEPVSNFEMHRTLFSPSADEKLYEYYRDVVKRLLGDGYEKHFSPEDFYLYMIAHEYKHYSGGGTGLRSLLDTFVFLGYFDGKLDMDYIRRELEKLRLTDFEKQNRNLALHLFGGESLMEADREMLDYILSSGTYGTTVHQVENKMKRNGGGKLRYALYRFCVPISRKNKNYAGFAHRYPFFYKHKILLPFLPFYRIFCAVKAGRLQAEAKALKNAKG